MGVIQLNSHSREDQITKIKMRLSLKLLILFVIFVACFELSNAKRGGGGRGGGSRGSSTSRGGRRWGGSSRSHSSSSSSSFGSNAYKKSKRKKAISTLKKVAVVGAVAYGAYQVGKMTQRFSNYGWGYNGGVNFNTWNRWRQADGFLCRNDKDCTWLDDNLECQKVGNFGWSINPNWFGGNERPIGECSCDDGWEWDDDDLQCEVQYRFGQWLGLGLVGTIIFIL